MCLLERVKVLHATDFFLNENHKSFINDIISLFINYFVTAIEYSRNATTVDINLCIH